MNFSLTKGNLPPKFKKDAVNQPLPHPIKKPSPPSKDLKNYHLVSVLCYMSKLVGQKVTKQLMEPTKSNNLDNPQQVACKTGHFTEAALLHMKNEIHLSL